MLAAAAATPASASAATVVDGDVRFEVVSPTLIRVQHAADRRFEDRPTINVAERGFKSPKYSVRRRGGLLEIRTRLVTLRYKRGSGAFTAENLEVRGFGVTAKPSFGPKPKDSIGPPALEVAPYEVAEAPDYRQPTKGNLGGWYRALDLAGGPVRMHDGVLSRDGWYLLDDSHTALLIDEPPGFAVRPQRQGAYQDGYVFVYGRDYARALSDLRRLTGSAPLLPRQAFGVWFSRYFNYRQSDYPPLLARFRAEQIPLDVLMVDTDFKFPHAWNGWNWNPSLFGDPKGFFDWAHREGIAVSLNTHPSITTDDPRFADAEARAGERLRADPTGLRCKAMVSVGDVYGTGIPGVSPDCRVFDWAKQGNQDAYLALHDPFESEGLDFWWLDYCCDESYALAPGLTQDTWINHVYARRSFERGSRWPLLSRVGSSVFDPDENGVGIWGEHRNVIHFTGDARPTWAMLDFQSHFTPAEGAVGIPYVSHDIGGFGAVTQDGTTGRHLPDDLYVRWVQSGTFQPILRLHSDHGDRLPWDYPGKAQQVATEFLRLRGALVPYLYTLAREAHDRGLPMTRPMYLAWPGSEESYARDRQFMLGRDLLVAPVGSPGDPVFARAGAVVPLQHHARRNTSSPDALAIDLYPGRGGRFRLYEDVGDGLDFRRRRFARTTFAQRRVGRRVDVLIGGARGRYAGRPKRRRYELRVLGTRRPRVVRIDGRRLRGWTFSDGELVIRTGALRTDRTARLAVR